MMTLGSLFDGIGGFPLAAVHCGGVPVWASEIGTVSHEGNQTSVSRYDPWGTLQNWMEQNCRLWM